MDSNTTKHPLAHQAYEALKGFPTKLIRLQYSRPRPMFYIIEEINQNGFIQH